MITVKPNKSNCFDLILNLNTQLSHHDPATQDGSNTLTFNRQKQLVERKIPSFSISQEVLNDFCQHFQVPESLLALIQQVPVEQFIAIATIKTLLDMYNSMDGAGLLSGMNRYDLLETRTRSSSTRRYTLHSFWSAICADLQLPIQSGKHDELLVKLFSLPVGIQTLVLNCMMIDYRSIITIARVWHTEGKASIEQYANKAGVAQSVMVTANFDATLASKTSQRIVSMEVPAISANSLRHCLVRESGWLHLVKWLEINDVTHGIPVGIEALFVNGGNKRAGAKEPAGASRLAIQIRKNYPILDLLSGVADTFDLGEGLLSVASHLVCSENIDKLGDVASTLPQADISVYDMLDTVTMTRQATQHGLHQMIFNQEVLASGVAVVARLSLHPLSSEIAKSALVASINHFSDSPYIGGQSARGFGWASCAWASDSVPSSELYESYLTDNLSFLRNGLIEGTLGTEVKLCQ